MPFNDFVRAALRMAAALLVCASALAQNSPVPRTTGVESQAPAGWDGKWLTTLSCPSKGNTEGYSWQFVSLIQNSNFRGEHGTAGEPGYLLIEGRIGGNGSAKLVATGIVASRRYARGIFAHKGEEYSYDIKAQFSDSEGTGTKRAGLGIVGRTCNFEFVRQ